MSPILSFITAAKLYSSKLLSIPLYQLFVGAMMVLICQYQVSLLLLLIFVCLDFITGLWKSKKNDKVGFKSTKFGYSIEKLGVYSIFISIGIGLDIHFTTSLITSIFLGSMLIRESWSVIENLDAITGSNYFSTIFDKVKDLLNKKTNV